MKMLHRRRLNLAELINASDGRQERSIVSFERILPLSTLNIAYTLRGGAAQFSNRSIMLRTRSQLATVLAATSLDGVARRLLFCPADVPDQYIPILMRDGEADSIITDSDIILEPPDRTGQEALAEISDLNTEWILFTSGTSGIPKLVQHSFESLIAPLASGFSPTSVRWGTFYDVRRYGGIQILLRALIGGSSIILSEAAEPVASFLMRLARADATHISGTPSHWRCALMSGAANLIRPSYIRLSGEMAGQDILNLLHTTYPDAAITHAYASTEAGVAFEVDDGRAGFPISTLNSQPPRPQIRIENNTIHVRSASIAMRYLGSSSNHFLTPDGYVDTGDVVERRGNRFFFSGRREGIVNIGGMKVHPEEVEATINQHPAIALSRVWGRASPITGTLIAADVVLKTPCNGEAHDFAKIQDEVMTLCRTSLAPHKVPVRLTEVYEIPITAAGKIERFHA